MNEIEVYVGITGQKDEYGRGGKITGIFLLRSQAEEHVKHRGWYGGTGEVERRAAITSDGKMWLLDEDIPFALPNNLEERRPILDPMHKSKLREQAISKARRVLTDAEWELLQVPNS